MVRKIALLFIILTASIYTLTSPEAALGSQSSSIVETEFVIAAPQFMQIFTNLRDPVKIEFLQEQLKTPLAPDADSRAIATRKLMRLLVALTADSNDFATAKRILELYADAILPESIRNLNLGKLEALSIYSYSTDDYKFINPELRKQNPSKSALDYAAMVNESLDKLPPFLGDTKRGVNLPASELGKMIVGNVIEFASFTSTTADLSLLNFEKRHRLIIHSKNGRDISQISANPKEREVLYKSGSKFKVLSVKENITLNGSTAEIQIELEEI